jgi:hypothetical protein
MYSPMEIDKPHKLTWITYYVEIYIHYLSGSFFSFLHAIFQRLPRQSSPSGARDHEQELVFGPQRIDTDSTR